MFSAILSIFAAASASVVAGHSQLAIQNCTVGEVYALTSAECEITLTNQGNKPIRVFDFHPVDTIGSTDPKQLVIAPHAQAYIKVQLQSGGVPGGRYHVFHFRTDEKNFPERMSSAYTFVMTALDQARPELDYGVQNMPVDLAQKRIELSSHDAADFRITKILESPAWLDTSLGADGHSLIGKIRPDAGWGLHVDYVKLAINSPQQKQAWVTVRADIHGDVVPASNPFDLGLMRFGNHNEFRIPLTSRSGKNFQIGKIELENVRGTSQIIPCVPVRDGCQLLMLTISDEQAAGSVKGSVRISLPQFHQQLNLGVWGLIVSKDYKMQTMDAAKLNNAPGTAGKSKLGNTGIEVGSALKRAVENANALAPPGTGPLLKWTIANGVGIHGFQIFRADREVGPYVLVNPFSVRSIAENQEPVSYQWRDVGTKSGKTYWYYIGIIYADGHKQQLSGPQKVIAK